jgi:putative membrane protein
MDYMFQAGFLGTRAPLFMDIVTFIVAALPLLVVLGIYLAKIKKDKLHALFQNVLFVVSIIVVGYFELGVRVGGGFDAFIKGSGVSHTYASIVLVLHVLISIATLYIWSKTIYSSNKMFKNKLLPGSMTLKHKKDALKTFIGIVFTSFSGIWVYLLLFVF